MDRRTFVEALGAVCLTANGRLLHGAGILNGEVSADVAIPALVPVPSSVAGVKQPVVNLAGEWRVNMNPPAEFWKSARVVMPSGKTSVHLRLDSDIVEWFKANGKGHLTRMNSVLRAYVETQKRCG